MQNETPAETLARLRKLKEAPLNRYLMSDFEAPGLIEEQLQQHSDYLECFSLAESLAAECERLQGLMREMVEAWDWWVIDQYDRCQSVPANAVDDIRQALRAAETASVGGGDA